MDWRQTLAENDRWLRAIVFVRVRDPELVDEIMQEVALAAIQALSPPCDARKVAPWLYRVAVRQVLLYRRKCGRRKNIETKFVARRQTLRDDEGSRDPLAWLLAAERRTLVRDALATLGPHEAEILLLKYTENWTCQQLANHLGVSRSAVEARLFRARRRLREAISTKESASIPGVS
jgi:RNA polymerase sigma-70 factor (ECF subfamily)